ncbi:MAG TPA: PAS domain-containing sensor histidine kinase, partial [Alphaproteobacteria bacterium]|nr:PAS domain-containing sensor histidine kinase [Alphaproteobacteria bacterium]HCD80248.1 PAS domain-containing sensor histidine kinase [Alphaproteobacteria bacterium]
MTEHIEPRSPASILRFSENRLGYLAVLTALSIGMLTVFTLARFDPAQQDNSLLTILIAVDFLAVIIVGGFVIRQILQLLNERRRRMAGYQLHWRIALMFGGVAALPAVIITAFALFVVDYSLRGWFADRISTAVTES